VHGPRQRGPGPHNHGNPRQNRLGLVGVDGDPFGAPGEPPAPLRGPLISVAAMSAPVAGDAGTLAVSKSNCFLAISGLTRKPVRLSEDTATICPQRKPRYLPEDSS
jgi:hypothetical protein